MSGAASSQLSAARTRGGGEVTAARRFGGGIWNQLLAPTALSDLSEKTDCEHPTSPRGELPRPTPRPRTHHPAASRSAGLQPVLACRLSFDSGAFGVGVASRGRARL